MEKNRKLNVDNIGTVVKDYTSINRRETRDVAPEGSRCDTHDTAYATALCHHNLVSASRDANHVGHI
jgi:hypothetical protein